MLSGERDCSLAVEFWIIKSISAIFNYFVGQMKIVYGFEYSKSI